MSTLALAELGGITSATAAAIADPDARIWAEPESGPESEPEVAPTDCHPEPEAEPW
jgi:hypothetical protein